MITEKQATAFLETKKIETRETDVHQAILKLDAKAKEFGLLIIDKHPDFNTLNVDWQEEQKITAKRQKRLVELVTNLPKTPWKGEFSELSEILAGKEFSKYVPKIWNRFASLMYQEGWTRRSFRAPNRPDLHATMQINFLQGMSELNYDLTLKEAIQFQNYQYFGYNTMPVIIAQALDDDAEGIFDLCRDIIFNEDEIGTVSRVLVKGILISERKDAWVLVEKLLLAAQRQEGLRQTVLEALDETSLGALKHFLKVILDNDLMRFSAVVRAMDVWAGFGWDAPRKGAIKRSIELALNFLDNESQISTAISSKDNLEVYMALWAAGCSDIEKAIGFVEQILNNKKSTSAQKAVALYFLDQTELTPEKNRIAYPFLKNLDVKVQVFALENISNLKKADFPNAFEDLEYVLESFPEKAKTFTSYLFEWNSFIVSKKLVFEEMLRLSASDETYDFWDLEKHFSNMSADHRYNFAQKVFPGYNYWDREQSKDKKTLTKRQRDFAFSIFKDRSESVRSLAMKAVLDSGTIDENEAPIFENLLTRKSAETRRSCIKLLMMQQPISLKKSLENLLSARDQMQRLAGLDIGLQLKEKKELTDDLRQPILNFKEKGKITQKEQIVLDNILISDSEYNWENGIGLYDPSKLATSEQPSMPSADSEVMQLRKLGFNDLSMPVEKVVEQLEKLDALFEANKDFEYKSEQYDNTVENYLLGNHFTRKSSHNSRKENETPMEILQDYPLPDVWIKWFEDSTLLPSDLQILNQGDSFYGHYGEKEAYKCIANWHRDLINEFKPNFFFYTEPTKKYKYLGSIASILNLLSESFPVKNKFRFSIEMTAFIFSKIPQNSISEKYKNACYECPDNWQNDSNLSKYLNQISGKEKEMSDKDLKDYFNLVNWKCLTSEDFSSPPGLIFEMHNRGFLSKNEVYHSILKNSERILQSLISPKQKYYYQHEYYPESYPFLEKIKDNCRARILEIELKRGDSTTIVSGLVGQISYLYGIDNLVKILHAFGKENINRGYLGYYSNQGMSKKQSLSHLLKNVHPAEGEDFEVFKTKIKPAKISDQRLLEVAMYAPQWLTYVANYLGWKGLENATWWLHAHTNEYDSSRKASEVAKYSPIKIEEFTDGAVDVDWFRDAYGELGKKRWEMLYQTAKYISDGIGHKRAQLYADAILGKLKMREVKTKITDKRNKDYVRLFGLIKLSNKTPQKDLLTRYEMLQKFLKESKQFGSQRQASEKLAVRIALDNLSRTAGYPDPIRLTWAMEAVAAAAIFEKGTVVKEGDYQVELTVDEQGMANVAASKEGTVLKAIPAKLKKDKRVVLLLANRKKLREQYRRSRAALEDAMVRGDEFMPSELAALMNHPVIAPMVRKLVFVSGEAFGFWKNEGLFSIENSKIELSDDAKIRIAHCTDFQKAGNWAAIQRRLFEEKTIQPFKQVFRELYIPTEDELDAKARSRRYAGHQVQPKKTLALLKTRGWTVNYDEGLQKVFHKHNFIAKLYAMVDWYTAADVENPTLETVEFIYRDSYKNVPFEKIDARIYSEIMRDIDLVVSVAHAGGVDPEASLSTIEFRKVLLEETLRLFKISNVEIKGNHAFIKGKVNDYSVHLGSAVIHRQPGGYVAVIPVHSQHRGRIFLPFADDDPKSSEVLSKILMLAEDDKIQDPKIVRQLVS